MTNNILQDTSYYNNLQHSPEKINHINYNRLLEKHSHCLREKELKYLKDFEIKESQFYGLPKIHKSKQIMTKCENNSDSCIHIYDVNDLKLRPIIAGPSCLTNRLSNLLDIILKPLIKNVPSFLRDTTDFLNKLPSTTPENTILVSFDVESLYSNICHDLGLTAIKYWLENYTNEIPNRFSNEFILDSLSFVLENNTFQFNDTFFKQTKGTAMGTKVAPTYATLTIGYLEQELYKQISDEFGENYGKEFKEKWKRFLDDCFILWTRSENELEKLHFILNNLHKHINFTIEKNTTELSFLDCLVKKKNNKIETDIFYKSTDSKTYLLFQSCHPKHIKVSIPFSLARRLKTIISEPQILEHRFKELEKLLTKQKYPITLIKGGIEKARKLDRNSLLTEIKDKSSTNIIPFVSTYNPRNPETYQEIQQDVNILKRDPYMNDILKNYKIIKSKRQPPNLKHLLTKAKFSEIYNTPKVTRCRRSNCGLCKHLIEGEKVDFKCGKTFTVKINMSCDVKNVIYVIFCRGCGGEYIGETGELRKRVTVHRQQINDPNTRMLRVSQHIDECTASQPKFYIFPFYKMSSENITSRRQKEKLFIKQLKPSLN